MLGIFHSHSIFTYRSIVSTRQGEAGRQQHITRSPTHQHAWTLPYPSRLVLTQFLPRNQPKGGYRRCRCPFSHWTCALCFIYSHFSADPVLTQKSAQRSVPDIGVTVLTLDIRAATGTKVSAHPTATKTSPFLRAGVYWTSPKTRTCTRRQ